MDRKSVGFRFKGAEIEALDAYAEAHGLTRTEVVKKALNRMIGKPSIDAARIRDEDGHRTERTTVYLTPIELQGVKEKAARFGMPRSDYLRRRALGHRMPPPIKGAAVLMTELSKQGGNLNQIAKQLNQAAFQPSRPYPDGAKILEQLVKTQGVLQELVRKIMPPKRHLLRRPSTRAKAVKE